MLSTYLGEGTVRAAPEAGASAYVTKAVGLPELSRAAASGPQVSAGSAPEIVQHLHRLVSSRIQGTQPIDLAAQGLTNKAIRSGLISPAFENNLADTV